MATLQSVVMFLPFETIRKERVPNPKGSQVPPEGLIVFLFDELKCIAKIGLMGQMPRFQRDKESYYTHH